MEQVTGKSSVKRSITIPAYVTSNFTAFFFCFLITLIKKNLLNQFIQFLVTYLWKSIATMMLSQITHVFVIRSSHTQCHTIFVLSGTEIGAGQSVCGNTERPHTNPVLLLTHCRPELRSTDWLPTESYFRASFWNQYWLILLSFRQTEAEQHGERILWKKKEKSSKAKSLRWNGYFCSLCYKAGIVDVGYVM